MDNLTKAIELKNQLKEVQKEIFLDMVQGISNKCKELGLPEFRWTQYTPYWRDGSVCEFELNIEGWQFELYSEEELENLGYFNKSEVAGWAELASDQICEYIESLNLPIEIFQSAGEGLVKVYPDGAYAIENFDHD
jgi:hypothetical protein